MVVLVSIEAFPQVSLDVDRALREDQDGRMGEHAQCQHWSELMSCVWRCFAECKTVFSTERCLLIHCRGKKCSKGKTISVVAFISGCVSVMDQMSDFDTLSNLWMHSALRLWGSVGSEESAVVPNYSNYLRHEKCIYSACGWKCVRSLKLYLHYTNTGSVKPVAVTVMVLFWSQAL